MIVSKIHVWDWSKKIDFVQEFLLILERFWAIRSLFEICFRGLKKSVFLTYIFVGPMKNYCYNQLILLENKNGEACSEKDG